MKQIRVKSNHVDINFKDVAAIADRMVWTGRLPTPDAVSEQLRVRSNGMVGKYLALWRAGYSGGPADKTHIADLPSELKHLLAEDFERRVAALKAKLDAERAQIRVEGDKLAMVNEQRASQVRELNAALRDAGSRSDEQARRIAMLENEIASERNLRIQLEQRIKDARQELTKVEHRLEDPPSDMAGGA